MQWLVHYLAIITSFHELLFILKYYWPIIPYLKDFVSCLLVYEVPSTKFLMTSLKDIKDLIFLNTMFDLEIWSSVIEIPIYRGIGSTLLYDFSLVLGGKILWKLPCTKIIGYICIPGSVSRNIKEIFIRERILNRNAIFININLEKKSTTTLSFPGL